MTAADWEPTPPRPGSLDDASDGPTVCDDCGHTFPADELTDCGTHLHCEDCRRWAPCSECKRITAEMAQDREDDRLYDLHRESSW